MKGITVRNGSDGIRDHVAHYDNSHMVGLVGSGISGQTPCSTAGVFWVGMANPSGPLRLGQAAERKAYELLQLLSDIVTDRIKRIPIVVCGILVTATFLNSAILLWQIQDYQIQSLLRGPISLNVR